MARTAVEVAHRGGSNSKAQPPALAPRAWPRSKRDSRAVSRSFAPLKLMPAPAQKPGLEAEGLARTHGSPAAGRTLGSRFKVLGPRSRSRRTPGGGGVLRVLSGARANMPPQKSRRDIPNPNRIESLNIFNPCIATSLIVLLGVILVYLIASEGWYSVHYKDTAEGREYCQLSLLECTLATCRGVASGVSAGRTGYTGYEGEGDCSSWKASIFFFACAAAYCFAYALYMMGILHGQAGNWKKYAEAGRYSGCCVDTSIDLGEACPGEVCADRGPCRGKLPHGALGLGAPILMLLGLMNFVNQDLSHFDGIDATFGFNFWLCVGSLVLCCFCIVAIAFDASNDEEAIRAKLGQRVAQRALPPRQPRPARPAPAAGGGGGGGEDDEDDGPTEGERVSAALTDFAGKAKGFGAGVASRVRSATPERGERGGGDAPKRPPPALPPARPGTPPRSVPARP
eukprot:COSAG06_NODE_4971_length_3817_cov_12938.856374_6_plen_455_part_00